jgi:serine/threonine protein phosphatase 1
MAYQKHLHLPVNTQGHDYIVGDLHGNKYKLGRLLIYIRFDPEIDRLFSVGDLIDRGPNSIECAELIYKDYFYPVMGNHELMMIESIIGNDSQHRQCWVDNGGEWHQSHTIEEMTQLAHDLSVNPMIISVGEDEHRFNIVHAELYDYNYQTDELNPIDNSWIDEWKFTRAQEDNLLWGRNIIDMHWSFITRTPRISRNQFHSNKLSTTYVGHSTYGTKNVVQIQQHVYLDSGCCYGGPLSIASPTRNLLFQYHKNNMCTTKDLDLIQKINKVS